MDYSIIIYNIIIYIPSILFNIENCICEFMRISGCATGGFGKVEFAFFTVHIFMDSRAHVMFLKGKGVWGLPS
jgi:hypothetical protein